MTQFNICVGVDGSASSRAALSTAVKEACAHNGTVHAVTAWHVDLIEAERYGGFITDDERHGAEESARKTQEAAIDVVLADLKVTPSIERHIIRGLPGPVLVASTRDCQFLVVGTEHKGVLKRTLVGSTSQYCTRHSHIPVIVVPHVTEEHISTLA